MAPNYLSEMTNKRLQEDLEDLRYEIDRTIDIVEKLEYDIDTYRSAGFTGFVRFDLFADSDKMYMIEHYKESAEMVKRLDDEKKYLADLRKEYQNVHDELMIRFYESMGYIEKPTTKPVTIEDSDVFDESAFGPPIYVN